MHEIKVLSDEEFVEYRKKQRRQSFFSELEKMSKPNSRRSGSSSFSVKDIKPDEKKAPEEPTSVTSGIEPLNTFTDEWGEFMGEIEGGAQYMSPIESVTDQRIVGYQLDEDMMEDADRFSKVFKNELAMLSEVLKDVKVHGTRVNNELKKMTPTGKGAGNRSAGVSKGYSDLVEAYNSINTSKVQIIKTMADLRSKQMEWRLKDKAANPDVSQDTETLADLYYKRIISGGTRNFVQNSMQNYAPSNFEYETINDSDGDDSEGDPSELDSLEIGVGFNITQPFSGGRTVQEAGILGDEFGNIGREKNPVDICVFEYGDGEYQFAALDQDGEVVEGVELPSDIDPNIVHNLTVRPGSEYVYDKYNRKYRVIQMGGVDASDVDDMEYPYNY